jgi:hypothetical protein
MNRPEQLQLHPEDGDLIRFLDHELERGECRLVMSHLSGCMECSERLAALGDRLQGLNALIAQMDAAAEAAAAHRGRIAAAVDEAATTAPRRRWSFRNDWMRAAAAITLMLGATISVQPVRAWVVDQWQALSGSAPSTNELAVEAPADAPLPSTTISFVPTQALFSLSLDAAQLTGDLELRVDDVEHASIEITGVVQDVVMLPSSVRIANTGQTTASYRIVLPTAVRTIVVYRADEPVHVFNVSPDDLPWSERVLLAP